MGKCTGFRCPMQHGYKVSECNLKDCPYRTEPITNADRIRAMNDEELAKCIFEIGFDCHLCSEHERLSDNPFSRHEKCDEKCTEHCFDWLQQPAEEDER